MLFDFLKRKKKAKLKQEDVKKVKCKYIGLIFNKLIVAPDDVIVLETETVISEVGAERLKDQLKKIWPDNKIMILEQGTKIKTAKDILIDEEMSGG